MGTVVCHCTERAHASLLNVAHIGTVPVTMTPRCLGASSLPVATGSMRPGGAAGASALHRSVGTRPGPPSAAAGRLMGGHLRVRAVGSLPARDTGTGPACRRAVCPGLFRAHAASGIGHDDSRPSPLALGPRSLLDARCTWGRSSSSMHSPSGKRYTQ